MLEGASEEERAVGSDWRQGTHHRDKVGNGGSEDNEDVHSGTQLAKGLKSFHVE